MSFVSRSLGSAMVSAATPRDYVRKAVRRCCGHGEFASCGVGPSVMRLWPGSPFPLGATYDGTGTNFAVFSEIAEQVDLCLFDADGTETAIALPEHTAQVWHGYAPS